MITKTLRRRQEKLRAQIEAELRTYTTGPPARRVTRLWLAAGYLVCMAACTAAALLPEKIVGFVWFADVCVSMVLLKAMLRATRYSADPLYGAADEMLTRIRDSYRSRAYPVLSVAILAAFAVFWLIPTAIEHRLVEAVMWFFILLAVGLPTLIACWSLPDSDQPAE